MITAKDEAVSLLNKYISYCHNCIDMKEKCAMKCGIGVCKAQIHDAKRISKAICEENIVVLAGNRNDVKVNAVIGIDKYFEDKILYWNDVKSEIQKI